MRHILLPILIVAAAQTAPAHAHAPPLLPEKTVAAMANEVNGESAKRYLAGIAAFHRQRGSQGFDAAARFVAEQARLAGLSHVEILQFPADGTIFYGTQRSRRPWDAKVGELSQIKGDTEIKVASYAAEPIVLAEDSESADVTGELIDVGKGTDESDYSNKNVAGQLVLVSAQAGDVQDLAVGKYHAAGIISYARNQPTAWSGDNDQQIRWGHLESFSANPTFAFMVSLGSARTLQHRLQQGETIRLHARVEAGQHPGAYEVVTATIDGADPALKDTEIAFSCHLDHQRPGANDNASGCATILEVGRTLQRLISQGTLPRPARTLRFIWPPEIEGTVTLLNARPRFAHRIKVAIHMDMVGGDPDTQSVFHVTRGPMSLPSFVHDVAWAFAAWVNDETYRFAATGQSQYPLIAPQGGKEPLRAEYSPFAMGSDHQVYQDSSFGIPAIYFNDWPDRYIHTNLDAVSNIDPTKLKRVALIGAASAWFLANFSAQDRPAAERAVEVGRLMRTVAALERGTGAAAGTNAVAAGTSAAEAVGAGTLSELQQKYESEVVASLSSFDGQQPARSEPATASDGTPVFRRRPEPKGPLAVFGYDYFEDHAKAAGIATPRLLSYSGDGKSGEDEDGYTYEALNFVDGKRSAGQIAACLSAEYGFVPTELVVEYLEALKKIGVVD